MISLALDPRRETCRTEKGDSEPGRHGASSGGRGEGSGGRDLAVAGRGHRHRRRGAEVGGGGEVHACAGRNGRAHEQSRGLSPVVTASRSRVDSRTGGYVKKEGYF